VQEADAKAGAPKHKALLHRRLEVLQEVHATRETHGRQDKDAENQAAEPKFNRMHLKRLTRKTICFSKKGDMHYGMMKAYIWHKNAAYSRHTF